jgi:hypothetical protein
MLIADLISLKPLHCKLKLSLVYVLMIFLCRLRVPPICHYRTLQALGRAVVIGETTGGGAHPTRGFPIGAAVRIAIPFARSIYPVTGTNWEGTGIVPDIAVPEAQARDAAYRQALQHVLSTGIHPPIADEARDVLAALPATDHG